MRGTLPKPTLRKLHLHSASILHSCSLPPPLPRQPQAGGLSAAGHSPGVVLLDSIRDRLQELGEREGPQVRCV